jgi:integrase
MALVAQRAGMPRRAEWTEISGINWDDASMPSPEAIWTVPAAKMKQELALRDDEAFEHKVALAAAAVEVLRAIRPLTGAGPLIFPNSRNAHEPLSENAVGYLYNREGWKGKHVPHGWRSSFSTIMNSRIERLFPGADRLQIDRLIIDLMLAHRPTGMSATEFRYHRSAYMERRRELAEDWSVLILDGAEPLSVVSDGPRRRRR